MEELPAEFGVEFEITEQGIQFNMLTDRDLELLIEGLKALIENINEMVTTSYKSHHDETVYFPFGQHMDKSRASVIIRIHYRQEADFIGPRIKITPVD